MEPFESPRAVSRTGPGPSFSAMYYVRSYLEMRVKKSAKATGGGNPAGRHLPDWFGLAHSQVPLGTAHDWNAIRLSIDRGWAAEVTEPVPRSSSQNRKRKGSP